MKLKVAMAFAKEAGLSITMEQANRIIAALTTTIKRYVKEEPSTLAAISADLIRRQQHLAPTAYRIIFRGSIQLFRALQFAEKQQTHSVYFTSYTGMPFK